MRLRNDRGTPVDPVPFVVVASVAFLLCFGFGPFYATLFGFSLRQGFVLTTAGYVAIVVVAFYRLVWTARPDLRGEVSSADRFRRLVQATVLLTLALILLTLPVVLR